MDGPLVPETKKRYQLTMIVYPTAVVIRETVPCLWNPFNRDSWGLHAPKPTADLRPGVYMCRFFSWGVVRWMILRDPKANRWVGKPWPEWKVEHRLGRWRIAHRNKEMRQVPIP